MSFARSVIQSRQKVMRSIAPAVAKALPSKQTANFWSTAPVQQEEPVKKIKEAAAKTVTAHDLARTIAETHYLSLAESKRILNTVLDNIVDNVADNKPVKLYGFGCFETYEAKGYTGRNPSNGETVLVPPKQRIRFRPNATFKKTVER